jgi:parvulin-like peptidyl-prolyl isomerase
MTPHKLFLNIKRLSILLCIAVIIGLLTIGCSKKEEGQAVSEDKKEKSAVIATVGERTITVADLKSYLTERPVSFRGDAVRGDVEKRLDALILEEVLYQEALRLNLEQDPDVRRRIRQMLNQKLIDQQINQKQWSREITEEELKAYYDQHRALYNRPAQVRVADIFMVAPADATDEAKAELKKKAQSVLVEAVKVRKQRTGFGNLVRKYSDKHEKYRQGDSGFFDIEGQPVGIEKNLAQAAFKLERVGSMPEDVIETAQGYHVIMLIGKRSAIHTPLDAVRNQIEQRMRREAVTEARQKYLAGLKNNAEIQVDRQILTTVLGELNSSPRAGKTSLATGKIPTKRESADTPPPLPGQVN